MKQPNSGELFTATIDRISGGGNGIIETDSGHINIGPVYGSSVGKEIEARMLTDVFAKCLTEFVKRPDYDTRFDMMLPSDVGVHDQLHNETTSDYSTLHDNISFDLGDSGVEFCSECGTLMYASGKRWKCDNCGNSEQKKTKSVNQDAESSEEKAESAAENSTAGTDSSSSRQYRPTNLRKLRQEAEENAIEQVPEGSTTTRHTTPEYTRSSKIRQYVKARANGHCEGCGDPAPFTSKTGEPYLHAHHIHELSDSGSDTPDTVIALCPNCHYRVHHGEDGDDYNQELLAIVQELEQ